jgi:hypothetical protein
MIVGVDFDNTIVSYDELFFGLALERHLIPPDFPVSKTRIRDHLRTRGQEDVWTGLQGLAYGSEIIRAPMFPGVGEFFNACRRRRVQVHIISHKTRRPYLGSDTDLHAAARSWIEHQGLQVHDVYFELTKEAKLARIEALGCSHFIDDLPEFLSLPNFPGGVNRILFDPLQLQAAPPGISRVSSWTEVCALLQRHSIAA